MPTAPSRTTDEQTEERALLADVTLVAQRFLRPLQSWEIDQVLGLTGLDNVAVGPMTTERLRPLADPALLLGTIRLWLWLWLYEITAR